MYGLSIIKHIINLLVRFDLPYLSQYRSFSLSRNKKIGNRPVEEAWKMKYYKGIIFKQIVQISGLCGLQFLSYLPKRFTHLSRAFYGDTILVHSFGAPIWLPEINKNI